MSENSFTWPDYVVFGFMLLISASIGLIFGWFDRKKKTSKDFLLGGGDLNVIPVGISILASFTSSIGILGFPAEMYRYGTMYWMIIISYPFTQVTAALIYAPMFHGLGITSAYEFFYMAVALYSPSLAIQQVTGIPIVYSIVGTGVICVIYTTIGGMKATVWIDTFQIVIMFSGIITIIVMGSLQIDGGLTKAFEIMKDNDRLEFISVDPDPFKRHTFWTLVVGGFFTHLTTYGANQGTIQRYLSVKKWTDASKAMMINLLGSIGILTLNCLCGVIAFAIYQCDLIGSGKVEKSEQILPELVMKVMGQFPGLPGLFLATIYSAALSTISSGMNSLSAICIVDFIKPLYRKIKKRNLDENKGAFIAKILALSFGIAAMALAYCCQFFGEQILQLTLSIFGILGGPILGVISLGMFIPYANWIGALIGLIFSTALNVWIGAGGVFTGLSPIKKNYTDKFCNSTDYSKNITLTKFDNYYVNDFEIRDFPESYLPDYNNLYIYRLSYLYYSLFAVLVVLILGVFISFVTYLFKLTPRKKIDKKFLFRLELYGSKKIYANDKKNNKLIKNEIVVDEIILKSFKKTDEVPGIKNFIDEKKSKLPEIDAT